MWSPWRRIDAVYVCTEAVDFRKGMGSLAVYVQDELDLDPLSACLFVFSNRRRDAVKVLGWDATGFALWHKKLERSRFCWPDHGGPVRLSVNELQWLLDGCDLASYQPHKAVVFNSVL